MLKLIIIAIGGLGLQTFVQCCDPFTRYHVSGVPVSFFYFCIVSKLYYYLQRHHISQIPWKQAKKQCEDMGMQLATAETPERLQAVMEEIQRANRSTHTWVGGNDLKLEGSFVWISGAPVGQLNWVQVAPNNAGGNEHCLELINMPAMGIRWQFNDNNCAVHNIFICEVQDCKGKEVGGTRKSQTFGNKSAKGSQVRYHSGTILIFHILLLLLLNSLKY